MKICRSCKVEKPLTDFYKHASMLDGHLNHCIPCVKNRVNKHRLQNLDKIRDYDKQRGSLPHRVQARKAYQQTEQGKESKKRAEKRYRKLYPIKYAAHVLVRNAIRNGKLIPAKFCSDCGSDQFIQGHHDDYTKPFEVRWLCRKCHYIWHQSNKPIPF